MKKYNTRDLFNAYLERNDLTIAYVSRKYQIPFSSLSEWARGLSSLKQKYVDRIEDFLKGNFLVPMDKIIEELTEGSDE